MLSHLTHLRTGQAHWRLCKKCQTLSLRGGPCFAGESHDHVGSGDYTVRENAGRTGGATARTARDSVQRKWRAGQVSGNPPGPRSGNRRLLCLSPSRLSTYAKQTTEPRLINMHDDKQALKDLNTKISVAENNGDCEWLATISRQGSRSNGRMSHGRSMTRLLSCKRSNLEALGLPHHRADRVVWDRAVVQCVVTVGNRVPHLRCLCGVKDTGKLLAWPMNLRDACQ